MFSPGSVMHEWYMEGDMASWEEGKKFLEEERKKDETRRSKLRKK